MYLPRPTCFQIYTDCEKKNGRAWFLLFPRGGYDSRDRVQLPGYRGLSTGGPECPVLAGPVCAVRCQQREGGGGHLLYIAGVVEMCRAKGVFCQFSLRRAF